MPLLEETKDADGARVLIGARADGVASQQSGVHVVSRVIDPLGLALENFDVTGKWRNNDRGVPVDPTGELYDGTKIDGPAGLRAALLKYEETLLAQLHREPDDLRARAQVEYYDMPAIRAIVRDAAQQDYKLSAFVLGVVDSHAVPHEPAAASETTAGR